SQVAAVPVPHAEDRPLSLRPVAAFAGVSVKEGEAPCLGSLFPGRADSQLDSVISMALERERQLNGLAGTGGELDGLAHHCLFRAVVARGGQLEVDGLSGG